MLIEILKKIIKFFIPAQFHPTIKAFYYYGDNVFCPCCNKRFRKFLTLFGRENAMCPFCGSMERHRLIYLYLKSKTGIFSEKIKLFHVAPEDVFISKFSGKKNINYYTGDLNSTKAAIKMDITHVPYKDNAFDVILCCHVLEHIIDDRKAMSEMYRVLKNNGWALLQHPVDQSRTVTYEDSTKTTPEEREKAFLQADHVRIYGKDLGQRLENEGFKVKVENYIHQIDCETVNKYGLKKDELIYLCCKQQNVN